MKQNQHARTSCDPKQTHKPIQRESKFRSLSESPDRLRDRYRPLWTILFALALIIWATTVSAQDPTLHETQFHRTQPPESQVDDSQADVFDLLEKSESGELVPAGTPDAEAFSHNSQSVDGGSIVHYAGENFVVTSNSIPQYRKLSALSRPNSVTVPSSVTVTAKLANFDSDSDPDGWVATLELYDRDQRRMSGIANVRFELIPRIPTSDEKGFINSSQSPVRWTTRVQFSSETPSYVKLKLNRRIDRVFDWPTGIQPASYLHSGRFSNRNGVLRTNRASRRVVVMTSDWMSETIRRDASMPRWGELTVKVALAGEGLLSARSEVRLRPSVLVDSSWPYR